MKKERTRKSKPVPSLLWLFLDFLKIGATAFGGFMALISVVQHQIVDRRRLLSQREMLDGISLATILPGPVAVNVVAYTGYKVRGALGAIVSAVAVILPSFVLIVVLSYAYFRWGQLPAVSKAFMGFVPAVTAVIVHAAWGMARKAKLGPPELTIATVAFLALAMKGGFYVTLIVVAASGLAGWLLFSRTPAATRPETGRRGDSPKPRPARLLAVEGPVLAAALLAFDTGVAAKLFFTLAGMSVLLFGGGFVFIPLIEHIVVQEHSWLTHQEFVDAIALGQVTPGPILISAAFIGYKLMGLAGAAIATVAIFLPPAVLMIFGTKALARARETLTVQAALRGIRAGVVGMVAAAAWSVGSTAVMGWQSALIFAAVLTALFRFRIDVAWVIPSAGLIGLMLY
ncbi:MAG TPA: chromate efflux transporter [Burkholderiales bacterium]